MHKRWGSCTLANTVVINTEAVKLPFSLSTISFLIPVEHSLQLRDVPRQIFMDDRLDKVQRFFYLFGLCVTFVQQQTFAIYLILHAQLPHHVCGSYTGDQEPQGGNLNQVYIF
jgi:hypothetical protein